MGVIDDIKDRLDIVEVIRERVKLQKAGRNHKGLCPFHTEKTPSFTVFPESQRWKCFGCGKSGDLVDFVQQFEQLDLQQAIQALAAKAGIQLQRSEETIRAEENRRRREDILGTVAAFFEAELGRHPAAMEYVKGRGWTEETAQAARLGYWAGDWLALRKALTDAGIDLSHPVAQAVLKIPPKMLVYPHVRSGRVHYLTARSIEEKRHHNLDRDLVGDKHPLFNQAYRRTGRVVVVEGQADAITLGQWGVSAIALAGCEAGSGTEARLLEILVRHGDVTLALDQDDAGYRAAGVLAESLIGAGLSATRIGVLAWPAKDANDWLRDGATAEQANEAIADAPCWLDESLSRFENAGAAERRVALEAAARAYASLDAVDQVTWRKCVCNRLEMTTAELRQLLEAVDEQEAGALQEAQYLVQRGMICRVNWNERGEFYLPLCNFDARIIEDVVEDDGEEQQRRFLIEGKLAKSGQRLAAVEVDSKEFGSMGWVLSMWGASASVAAGMSSKDHLRVALQVLSEPKTRYEYAHLGWRTLDGRPVYLSASGAVGLDGVQVRLPRDLENYRLPLEPVNVREAMAASLRFLETGDHQVTVPLWSAVYLAPLASVLPPSFTLWLFGTTGSLKSTVTALAMCHFGTFAYNTPPASWTGTANALEKLAFVAKDAPLWIDDYTAQSTLQGMNEIRKKADQLLRDWGNRAGKARMRSDLGIRRTFAPRGIIISTAEQLPPGQSILSRLFAIEVHPEHMTRGDGSPLTVAQTREQQLYPHAMSGYVRWLAGRQDWLKDTLKDRHPRYVEAARREGEHLRMPGNVAVMFLGFEMGLEFAAEVGALNAAEIDTLRNTGWQTLMHIGQQQHRVVEEEKPVDMYMRALEQMMASGVVYLRSLALPDAMTLPGKFSPMAEHVGWYDEQYYYLLPEVAYGAVWQFYKTSGVVFPDTERGVRVKLREQGLLHGQDGRATWRLRLLDGSQPRVLRVSRALETTGPEGAKEN